MNFFQGHIVFQPKQEFLGLVKASKDSSDVGMCLFCFWWKMTFVEEDVWWRTTFGGRQPFVEDDLWWKTTFGGRQPSVAFFYFP